MATVTDRPNSDSTVTDTESKASTDESPLCVTPECRNRFGWGGSWLLRTRTTGVLDSVLIAATAGQPERGAGARDCLDSELLDNGGISPQERLNSRNSRRGRPRKPTREECATRTARRSPWSSSVDAAGLRFEITRRLLARLPVDILRADRRLFRDAALPESNRLGWGGSW